MELPSLEAINRAAEIVSRSMPSSTPQYSWPLLNARAGAEVWIKHENHTQLGAFKIRGALVYMDWLRHAHPEVRSVVCATRGNFGQAIAFAARQNGLETVIIVPFGNSREKNRAMLALGAELIEHGTDFQSALEYARELAAERGAYITESFHPLLVHGTATYALELLRGAPELHTVYVPIGMGSSVCGMVAARNALGLATRIVGVVSDAAPAYALSFQAKRPVSHAVETKLADGLACRVPDPQAVDWIVGGVERVIEVSEEEVAEAMLALYQDTHNVAEGAGAASLAGLLSEREQMQGQRVGIVLTGGNVDREVFAEVLSVPSPAESPVGA
jgi:threonine dehydratase